MTAVRRFITTLLLMAGAGSLFAQGTAQSAPAPRTTEAVTAETDRDVDNPRALRLSLDDALATAMRQNLNIQVQRYEYGMAGQNLRGSYGIFDWFTTGTVQHSSTENPVANRLQASAERRTIANVGVSQLIPTGGVYDVSFSNARNATAGFGQLINPSYGSSLDLTFNQPLLRNFGVDVTRRGITIARNTLGINQEFFRTALLDTASAVEQAYLDLVYRRQYIDVVKESLFLARDQARITQIRIDVGASAPLDILQPRVQIATSEEALIRAVADVRDAEDRLRSLMHLPPEEWDRPILPTDRVSYTPVEVNVEQSVARAFELRPEIRQSRLATDTTRVQYVYARNQVLPRVDLAVGYGAAGIAGKALPTDPISGQPTGIHSTSYPTAVRDIFAGTFPAWNVGFNVGIPVTNIGARAEAKRAELDFRQSRTDEERTRQNIAVDVRATIRAMDTAAKEITASRTAREAAEQNLAAERKRYENGMTTNFQVLQVQQQLSDARARELQALVGYNSAVAAYHRAVGDLLEVHNIQVDTPQPEAEPRMFTLFDRYSWLNYGNRVRLEETPK